MSWLQSVSACTHKECSWLGQIREVKGYALAHDHVSVFKSLCVYTPLGMTYRTQCQDSVRTVSKQS